MRASVSRDQPEDDDGTERGEEWRRSVLVRASGSFHMEETDAHLTRLPGVW